MAWDVAVTHRVPEPRLTQNYRQASAIETELQLQTQLASKLSTRLRTRAVLLSGAEDDKAGPSAPAYFKGVASRIWARSGDSGSASAAAMRTGNAVWPIPSPLNSFESHRPLKANS